MTETKLTQIKTAIKDGKLVQEAGGITEDVTQSATTGATSTSTRSSSGRSTPNRP